MNRRSLFRTLAVAGAGSFLTRSLGAQPLLDQLPGSPGDDFVIRSEVRLVLLDVSVKDREGGLISGLSKDSFSVVEDGKPQPITVFDADDLPVTLGIIVDESRSMTPKRTAVLTAADALIAESNHNDEIFVLNFNEKVTRGLPPEIPFSDDTVQLHDALYRGIPEGRTALNDAVIDGLRQLERGRRAKKTLVLISDGGDNESTHARREMLDVVERGIATIYTIGLFDADNSDRDPGILKELAKISGGEAYFPATPGDMLPVCHRIARDIRARYTLGYLPQAGGASKLLRHIQIRVSAPGYSKLITRSRSTYIYEGPETKARK